MALDLRSALPALLPKAISWAEERAVEIASTGFPLGLSDLSLARRVGVVRPER
jgi:hypothetical protein